MSGQQHARANASRCSSISRARLPAIAIPESPSNLKRLRQYLPRSLLREEAIYWPLRFLRSRQPVFFPAQGFCRTEFRLPWLNHHGAVRAPVPFEVDQFLPSIFAALLEWLFPSATRL